MASRGVGTRFLALGGGEAAARLLAFAATVYLARTLSPALFGIVGVAMGVMLYLTQIADGGIELVGVPLVARVQGSVAELAEPLLSVRFVIAVVTCAVVTLIGAFLLPQPDGVILALSSFALVATGVSTRWIHLGLERAGGVAIARAAGELLALVAILALVRGAADVALVPLGQFLGAALTSLILLVALARSGVRLRWRWNAAAARPVFARSRHLVVFTILGLLLFNFDLIYLRFRTGAEAAGYYAAAYTMISFAANLIVAFAHTVLPTLARISDDAERRAMYVTVSAQAFAVALPVGAGAWYVAGEVIRLLFGEAYLPGVVALQWLAWSIPLAALRELPVVALISAGRERDLLRVNAWTAACNVALVMALIPRFGLVGAAAATLVTELIRLALAAHFAQAAGYPVVPPSRLVKALAATVAMVIALVALAPSALWASIPLGAGVFVVTLAAVGGVRWGGRLPVLSV